LEILRIGFLVFHRSNLAARFSAEPIRNCFYSTAGWMSRSAVVMRLA
jgi:hypothetical protein